MSAYSRISKAFKAADVLPLCSHSKYILISDCHRGNGATGDNFLKNQNLYYAAMEYYLENGFTYIELGDGDELWENRNMAQITEIHGDVFNMLLKYYNRKRLYMLYGNHDMVKRKQSYAAKTCACHMTSDGETAELFPNIVFREGLILKDCEGKKDIYLTHGHQADFLNSCLWRLARFLVRYFWKPLENAGVSDPTSAAKNNSKKKRVERILTDWAKNENHILITGHTHRPMLGTKESPYFNTGSCIHPRCMTAIEIENRCMKLVKWTVRTRKNRILYVEREEIAGPMCIDDYS